MGRAPIRTGDVYVIGAGFSRAFGLPSTAELLTALHEWSDDGRLDGAAKDISKKLQDAYDYFFPSHGEHFRPDPMDFFSIMAAYEDVRGHGLPQQFKHPMLLGELQRCVARILTARVHEVRPALRGQHALLDQMLIKGNVIVTTNWDTLLEQASRERGVPVRLRDRKADAVSILKLHGSVDWVLKTEAKKSWSKNNYRSLGDLLDGRRSTSLANQPIARVPIIEDPSSGWQLLRGSVKTPFIATMARSKAAHVNPLQDVWRSAYGGLSAAKRIHVIGYSLPTDDVEIRALLRSGVQRGSARPAVRVTNPAPDTHTRIRFCIHDQIESDFAAVSGTG